MFKPSETIFAQSSATYSGDFTNKTYSLAADHFSFKFLEYDALLVFLDKTH